MMFLHGHVLIMSLCNVQIAEQENECKDATEDLEESKKFLAELEVNCELTELAEYGNLMRQECSLW